MEGRGGETIVTWDDSLQRAHQEPTERRGEEEGEEERREIPTFA